MAARLDLFDSTYGNFTEAVLQAVREETFDRDIGQNSWLTADEYDRFLTWLQPNPEHHVLEVASGSGGPAVYLASRARCRVTGIDSNPAGIAAAAKSAAHARLSERVRFRLADANESLPFDSAHFDSLFCIDSMNHFPDRLATLREWQRVLRPGGLAVFTDPVVVTGPVTNDELALRSSIGRFLFTPPGINEQLISSAGLRLLWQEDVTASAALVSGRWHAARHRHRESLLEIEGEERFAGLQRFFETVHRLTSEKRLSRIVYLAEKGGRRVI